MASLSLYFDNPPVPNTVYSRVQAGNRRALWYHYLKIYTDIKE
jgi:hypothetical protein